MRIEYVLTRIQDSLDATINNKSDFQHLLMQKVRDSHFPDLLELFKKEGIKDPIAIHCGILGNGHHRLAAAMILDCQINALFDKGFNPKITDTHFSESPSYIDYTEDTDDTYVSAFKEAWRKHKKWIRI